VRCWVGLERDSRVRTAILASQPTPGWPPSTPTAATGTAPGSPSWSPGPGGGGPAGTRAICRRERPPGCAADLQRRRRLALPGGHHRPARPDLARLALRHRHHARVEDPLRAARPPAPATCPSTGGDATPSGSRSSCSPSTWSAGPKPCCGRAPWPWLHPRPCASGGGRSPVAAAATPGGSGCGGSAPGPGRPSWSARSPAWTPGRCAVARAERLTVHDPARRSARRARRTPPLDGRPAPAAPDRPPEPHRSIERDLWPLPGSDPGRQQTNLPGPRKLRLISNHPKDRLARARWI
jgi:hypothetical protein